MNIFSALAQDQGKGSINEANTSSFLAYLMAPDESHGLKREFLFRLLKKLGLNKFCNADDYYYEIALEREYEKTTPSEKDRIIDIQINIFKKNNNTLEQVQVVAIENKVKQGAVQPEQFKQEYGNIKKAYKDIPILMVFLAPNNQAYQKEFDNLIIEDSNKTDKKFYFFWEEVIAILKNILKDENDIEIEPLADYLKHTIRAFVYFINLRVLKRQTKSVDIVLYSSNAKEKVKVVYTYKDNSKYEMLVFEKNFVRIKDLNGRDSDGYVVKDMLQDIYDKLGMKKGKYDNTQDMGKKIAAKVKKDNIKQPIEIDTANPKFSPIYKNRGCNIFNIDDTNAAEQK